MNTETAEQQVSLLDNFVFMDKTISILDVGMKTEKNVVLYGPGGHGKSELALEYFYEKNINPYVITMGSGMTTDRLFGGLNIPVLEVDGKIEYLVENSFMNHEYVILEEMMDSPDFILEQLKDILSSGVFRNGSQVFVIKTKFIVGCTNKTRSEFAKNASLKALMERFPLELNVIWDNYTEISYNALLEKRYGAGQVDPIMPFLFQEYVKNGITISPRIALDSYEIYQECGPDALTFIAEFAQKPSLIKDALKKFEATVKFKEISADIDEVLTSLSNNDNRTKVKKQKFIDDYRALENKLTKLKSMTVNDDMAQIHSNVLKRVTSEISGKQSRYNNCIDKLEEADELEAEKNISDLVGAVAKKKSKSKQSPAADNDYPF